MARVFWNIQVQIVYNSTVTELHHIYATASISSDVYLKEKTWNPRFFVGEISCSWTPTFCQEFTDLDCAASFFFFENAWCGMPNKIQQIIDTLSPTKVMVQWKIAGCWEKIGKVTIIVDTPIHPIFRTMIVRGRVNGACLFKPLFELYIIFPTFLGYPVLFEPTSPSKSDSLRVTSRLL